MLTTTPYSPVPPVAATKPVAFTVFSLSSWMQVSLCHPITDIRAAIAGLVFVCVCLCIRYRKGQSSKLVSPSPDQHFCGENTKDSLFISSFFQSSGDCASFEQPLPFVPPCLLFPTPTSGNSLSTTLPCCSPSFK